MPKLIYVDGDDEIADVINRVRAVSDTDEVALVVPAAVRLLQTPVNLRLLRQFADSTGRKTAIVSPDPRTQHLATTSGFTAYASVQAYERGIELVRPHEGGVPDRQDAGEGVSAATATLVAPPPVAVPASTPAMPAAPPPGQRRAGVHHGERRRPYYFAAIAAAVVGGLLLLIVGPSATVTITLAADPITVGSTILGSPDESQAGRPDTLVTMVVTDDQTAQFRATPTGTQVVPAATASGAVSIVSQLPFTSSIDVPKGEEFDTADNPPVKFYATQATKVCIPGQGAPCKAGADPDLIPVADGTGEARGNVASGAIKVWPQNPCPDAGPTCSASDLGVVNSQPTSGGADEKKLVVASAQDLATWNSQSTSLQGEETTRMVANMAARAGSRSAAQDPSGGGRTTSCALTPPLPAVNQQFAPTDMTVACHAKEATYSVSEALAIVKRDMLAKVPQGDSLASNCHIPAPVVTLASDDGRVILSASGDCYAQPVVDVDGLRGQFTGKSAGAVSKLTRTRIGAQVIDVSTAQHPFGLPVLPFFENRIDVVFRIVPKRSGAP